MYAVMGSVLTAGGLLAVALLALLFTATPAFAHDGHGGPGPDPDMIAARQKFFGFENVDPRTGAVDKDKIVVSWLGHMSAAVSIRGRVVMLDTYIPRLEVAPGTIMKLGFTLAPL